MRKAQTRQVSPDYRTSKFSAVTESRELAMPEIELRMLYDRYSFVAEFSKDLTVIEVGCGQGLGAPFIARRARKVVLSDVNYDNITKVESVPGQYRICSSADNLPLVDGCVDVVAALEMVYYLPSLTAFLNECRRVLTPNGLLLLTLPNSSRPGFHRSPFSTSYPTVSQISAEFGKIGFLTQVFGVFALDKSPAARIVRLGMSIAEGMHLVPKSLQGRSKIKRVLQGRLSQFPGWTELENKFEGSIEARSLLEDDSDEYAMLYVVGRRKSLL